MSSTLNTQLPELEHGGRFLTNDNRKKKGTDTEKSTKKKSTTSQKTAKSNDPKISPIKIKIPKRFNASAPATATATATVTTTAISSSSAEKTKKKRKRSDITDQVSNDAPNEAKSNTETSSQKKKKTKVSTSTKNAPSKDSTRKPSSKKPDSAKKKVSSKKLSARAEIRIQLKHPKFADVSVIKKPSIAFLHFLKERQAEIDNVDLVDKTKILSHKWKAMSTKDQKPYEQMAHNDKKRYESEMSSATPLQLEKMKLKSDMRKAKSKEKRTYLQKELKLPKRYLTPFMMYSVQKRKQLKEKDPSLSFGELGKKIGAAWKLCTSDVVAEFKAQSEKAKAKYKAEIEAWKLVHPKHVNARGMII